MELIKSTIFLREYFYTTLSGMDVEYIALSYRQLETIQSKYSNKRNQSQIITVKTALLNDVDFSKLTSADLDLLYINIMEVSLVTNEMMETVKTALNIMFEDSFKDKSFKSCKVCQERNLDKQRNCPLLNEATHDKMVFYIVDKKKINICPMNSINSPIVNDAMRCHSILEAGVLPMSGGFYEQSMFFCEISSLIKGLVSSHQSEAMDKR